MNAPKRIQRKRTKGWRMPEGAVYVGRPTRWGNPFRITKRPTSVGAVCDVWGRYANGVRNEHAAGEAVRKYRKWLDGEMAHQMWNCHVPEDSALKPTTFVYEGSFNGRPPSTPKVARFAPPTFLLELEQLRGKDLVCWCPLDQPCHADVLLEIANAPLSAGVGT